MGWRGRSCNRVISFFALLRARPPSLNARPSLYALSTSAQGAGKGKKSARRRRGGPSLWKEQGSRTSRRRLGMTNLTRSPRQVRGEDAPARSEDAPWRGSSSRPGGPFLSCFCPLDRSLGGDPVTGPVAHNSDKATLVSALGAFRETLRPRDWGVAFADAVARAVPTKRLADARVDDAHGGGGAAARVRPRTLTYNASVPYESLLAFFDYSATAPT